MLYSCFKGHDIKLWLKHPLSKTHVLLWFLSHVCKSVTIPTFRSHFFLSVANFTIT